MADSVYLVDEFNNSKFLILLLYISWGVPWNLYGKKDNGQNTYVNTHTKQNYLSSGDINLVVSQRGWGLCNCPCPMCDVSQENKQMLFEFWSQGTVNPFLMISLFSNDFKRKTSLIIIIIIKIAY